MITAAGGGWRGRRSGKAGDREGTLCRVSVALLTLDCLSVLLHRADAGDVVLFLEATMHGSTRWTNPDRQR